MKICNTCVGSGKLRTIGCRFCNNDGKKRCKCWFLFHNDKCNQCDHDRFIVCKKCDGTGNISINCAKCRGNGYFY